LQRLDWRGKKENSIRLAKIRNPGFLDQRREGGECVPFTPVGCNTQLPRAYPMKNLEQCVEILVTQGCAFILNKGLDAGRKVSFKGSMAVPHGETTVRWFSRIAGNVYKVGLIFSQTNETPCPSAYATSKRLAQSLGLVMHLDDFNLYEDNGKKASSYLDDNHSSFLYFRKDLLREYMRDLRQSMIWIEIMRKYVKPSALTIWTSALY